MGRRLVMLALAGAGAAAVAGAVLFLPGEQGSQAAGVIPRTPAPEDPLTGQEVSRAAAIASAGSRTHMAAGRVELLYVERDDDKDTPARRRADAYLYDYGSDRLIVRTVDLGRGRVVRETVTRGVQPPPSKEEEATAAELLLTHREYGKGVREAFARAGGRRLTSAADLGLRGLIFTPSGEDGPARRCDTHRCLRLFVRLPDGTWLDTSRIVVDLSAKKIHTLEW
ncbi:hypothetical protein FHS43_005268 [Streptosporangium becharense]|uniref:Tat pathway signal sequence domain protein n=1 Tax=Streptosporangium becharense TaxID=1816182 RepID=A0A7W9MHW7_9ACTN|nr:hypothetical protein [Streptosporangium becharense]MBB2913959.1 hypothetical protein [Streptosporangium becharense]MBB5821380.1 hypothetical protein [Streptosporangium becharense]